MISHERFLATRWGKLQGGSELDRKLLFCAIDGVHAVEASKAPRLVNPLTLFGLALQAHSLHISLLLSTIGLDALLMAGSPGKFTDRLFNLLGEDSFVFPCYLDLGQPRYRVKDVAADLYDLRSALAHGREIPPKFRNKVGFLDTDGKEIFDGDPYTYAAVLHEASSVLLRQTLLKICSGKLFDVVADTSAWRQYLDAPRKW